MSDDDANPPPGPFDGLDGFNIPDNFVNDAAMSEPTPEIRQLARQTHMLYSALVEAGFDEPQALHLIAEMIKGAKQ